MCLCVGECAGVCCVSLGMCGRGGDLSVQLDTTRERVVTAHVFADCAEDPACGFLAVLTVGSEVSCDLYGWTSDNFACTTSGQVRGGSCGVVMLLVCPGSHAVMSV